MAQPVSQALTLDVEGGRVDEFVVLHGKPDPYVSGQVLTVFTETGREFDLVSFTYNSRLVRGRVPVMIRGSKNGLIKAKQAVELSGNLGGFTNKKKIALNSGFDDVDRVRIEYDAAVLEDTFENFTLRPALDYDPPVVRSIVLEDAPPANARSVGYRVSFDETPKGISAGDFRLKATGTALGMVTSVFRVGDSSVRVIVAGISGNGTLRLDVNNRSGILDATGNGNGVNGYVAGFTSGDMHRVDTGDKVAKPLGLPALPPATAAPRRAFAAARPEVEKLMAADAMRRLDAGIEADRSMLRGALDRLISDRKKRKACMKFADRRFCRETLLRDAIGFELDGTVRIKDKVFRSHGTFTTAKPAGGDEMQRVALGDFNIRMDKSGAVTASASTRFTWEHMLERGGLAGFHLGAGVGSATISGNLRGQADGMNVSAGPYFVSLLSKDLFISGFATLGYRRGDIKARNDDLTMQSKHSGYWTAAELTLTGLHRFTRFDLRPELSLSFGRAQPVNADFEVAALGLTDQMAFVGKGVSALELAFQPEFQIPLVRPHRPDDKAMLKVSPGVNCKRVKKTDLRDYCGGSLRLARSDSWRNGLSQMDYAIEFRGGKGPESVGATLKVEHRF